MKTIKKICSIVLIMCIMLTPVSAFAINTEGDCSFEKKVQMLSEKYGVTISMSPISSERITISEELEKSELDQLEARLATGKAALEKNNYQADKDWQRIIDSGRCNEEADIPNEISSKGNYTVYYYQKIGSYYPNGTTIRCYITANRVYSDYHNRYLWGSVVSTGSKLYSGYGSSWNETNCKTQRIDGGRTEYVQVWGTLKEKYTSGITEYTVTSEGWRIWYEATCPA